MTAVPHPLRTAPLAAWRDVGWPVLAGAVAAVGLLGLWRLTSLLAVAAMVAGLWLLVAITVYGVASEAGLRASTAVRIGLAAAVWTVVMLGLVDLLPVAGWLVGLAVGVTSPRLADWTAPYLRRATAAARRKRALPGPSDQGTVDRAFERIVTDLDNDAT
jgi:hypothetical protein